MMEDCLHRATFTPEDLKAAAVYAAIRYCLRNPRPFTIAADGRLFDGYGQPIHVDPTTERREIPPLSPDQLQAFADAATRERDDRAGSI